MTVQELGATTADIRAMRGELDELLRARQYATHRERRLAEAVRTASEPDLAHGYAQPHRSPDPDLVRQLRQAQTLREGLGTRCLELSERLLALEDLLRQSGPGGQDQLDPHLQTRRQTAAPPPAQGGQGGQGAVLRPEAAPGAPTVTSPASGRQRPTGARFGGAFQGHAPARASAAAPPGLAGPVTTDPVGPPSAVGEVPPAAAPMRGARFGGIRPAADGLDDAARQTRDSRPGTPSGSRAATAARGADDATPAPRDPRDISALAARIADLHRRGAAQESAAVTAQASVTLAPSDVVGLAGLLRTGGPYGASGYLVRAAAHGPARQAADTLAELRRVGLVDEAAELFHALWGLPAAGLPGLLAALERAGQAADGQTLLWEWASAPPAELADLSFRLAAAGRDGDVRSLLRQTAGRSIAEVAATVHVLDDRSAGGEGGRPGPGPVAAPAADGGADPVGGSGVSASLASVLVREVVRMRSASDVGGFAAAVADRPALYRVLLDAVATLDDGRSRNALAALRSAGLPTSPPPARTARSRGRR
ncbi:hypothetical protein [Kitasatospora paranensis]|uniref:Uncharacterized protein n=2 Tax=Kitasatospora paranensis TaxID=258053 RepID=A0ABW2FUI8_9ACTN